MRTIGRRDRLNLIEEDLIRLHLPLLLRSLFSGKDNEEDHNVAAKSFQ